jgi:hypothetical protein
MTTITTRSGKGSPLTNNEMDANLTGLNDDKVEASGDSMTGDLSFGDNNKVILGSGNDLQLYHDINDSYISDQGSGNLKLLTDEFRLRNAADSAHMLTGSQGGAITAYHNGNPKLATTSTGIDVSGSVVSDGLTVDASTAVVQASNAGGTTSFEISNTNGVSTANNKAALYLSATGAEANAARIESDFTGTVATNHAQDLKFYYVGVSSSPTLGMTLNSSGLDVTGNLTVDAGSNGKIDFGNVTTNYGRLYADSTGTFVGSVTADPLIFRTTNTERMRIDSSGLVGIGTSSPAAALDVNNGHIKLSAGYSLQWDDSHERIEQSNGNLEFFTNNSQQMTISGGNVGIGTTSPAGALHIYGGSYGEQYISSSNSAMRFVSTGGVNYIQSGTATSSSSAADLIFTNVGGSGETMRITSAGNAIFTKPNGAYLQLKDASAVRGAINVETSDGLVFSTGASFTERMRITSAGDVEIKSGGELITYRGDNARTGKLYTDNNAMTLLASHDPIKYWADDTAYHAFGFGSDTTTNEKMRLTYQGNLLVGTTVAPNTLLGASSTQGLAVNGSSGYLVAAASGQATAYFNRQTSDGTITEFRKDGTTVGSIGSIGGYAYIGSATTSDTFLTFVNSAIRPSTSSGAGRDNAIDLGQSGNRFKNLYLSGDAFLERVNTDHDGEWGMEMSGVSTARIRFNSSAGGSTTVGSITVSTTATAYNQSSDERLKENIVDAPSASDDIDALQVRSFDWKVNGEHQKYGMIAQELNTVAPDAVTIPDDPEEMAGVDYSKLVPMLVKEIQSLRARVAQLEGAN